MRLPVRLAAAGAALGLAVAAAAVTAPASAAPTKKGTTYVVPSELTLSVLKGVAKPGALTDRGAAFGIVGNPNDGTIEHVGGLYVAGVGGTLKLSNFTIDLTTDPDGEGQYIAQVTGLVNDTVRVPLFNVDGSLGLHFTSVASTAVVGSGAITDALAGTATIDRP